MTQQYTPVTWQDETTSQQGTLINAERLNQMQTAHHYADGWEEVDTVPTADPGVSYHKVVYCTADSTFYRWNGTEWTADIDDETKALLQQEIARATQAEGELAQDIADETTARETADTAMQADITALESGKLDKKTTAPNQTQVYAVRGSAQRMITVGYGPSEIPEYNLETVLFSKMPTLNDPTDETVVNYGWATGQIGAEATARAEADTLLGNRITAEETRATQAEQANAQAIANTYTKSETDTLLSAKADVATTYTKSETDTLLGAKADQATTYTKAETDTLLAGYVTLGTAQTIPGAKTFTDRTTFQHDNNNVILSNPNYTAGTNPSSDKYTSILFRGSTATTQGWINQVVKTDGSTRYQLRTYNISGANYKQMEIFCMADGTGYATAPTPASTAPTDAVTTISYVSQTGDSAPNNLLHKSGNETKNGQLTMTYPGIFTAAVKIVEFSAGTASTATYRLMFKIARASITTYFRNITVFTEIGRANTSRGLTYILLSIHQGNVDGINAFNIGRTNSEVIKYAITYDTDYVYVYRKNESNSGISSNSFLVFETFNGDPSKSYPAFTAGTVADDTDNYVGTLIQEVTIS